MLKKYLLPALLVLSLGNPAVAASSQAARGARLGSASQTKLLQPSSPDNWLGGTGNWSNGSDWSSGLPGSASDVAINTSSDYVTLDTSSSINSLTVGGHGTQQSSILIGDGSAHSLHIAGSLTVGQSGYFQLQNDAVTASSLTERGYLDLSGGSTLTIHGDAIVNSGALLSTSYGYLGSGGNNTLNIAGTLTNSVGGQFYVMGQGDVANIGQLINHSDVQINSGATLNLTNQPGLSDIASDEDYSVAGRFNAEGHPALANLTTVEGALVLFGQDTQITPLGGTLTLNGSGGGFGGRFLLFRNSIVHINGNFENVSGGMAVGNYQQVDPSNFYVSGTLTLGSGSSLQIWGQGAMVSAGSLNVTGGILAPFVDATLRVSGNVTNSGCIGYCAGGPTGSNTYDIGGTFNNTSSGTLSLWANDRMNAAAVVSSGFMTFPDSARLNTGSLTLNPGSYLNIGITGPNSFGMILATGSVALNGELFVNVAGYDPPVGQEFKFLTFIPGALSGTFSSVVSNGENFAVDYNDSGGYVALIAEGSVPEPGSFILFGSGFLSPAAMARRRMKA